MPLLVNTRSMSKVLLSTFESQHFMLEWREFSDFGQTQEHDHIC